MIKNGDVIQNSPDDCHICICQYGTLLCTPICNETSDTCNSKSNDLESYQWVEPQIGECCGKCVKQPSKSIIFYRY